MKLWIVKWNNGIKSQHIGNNSMESPQFLDILKKTNKKKITSTAFIEMYWSQWLLLQTVILKDWNSKSVLNNLKCSTSCFFQTKSVHSLANWIFIVIGWLKNAEMFTNLTDCVQKTGINISPLMNWLKITKKKQKTIKTLFQFICLVQRSFQMPRKIPFSWHEAVSTIKERHQIATPL